MVSRWLSVCLAVRTHRWVLRWLYLINTQKSWIVWLNVDLWGNNIATSVLNPFVRMSVRPSVFRFRTITWVSVNWFSLNLVCALILWRSGLGLLMGKFRKFFTELSIFCHRGVQLILAYSWARPAILVAGKGREVMFLFLLFLHFHSCSSFFPVPLFHLFCYLFCLFSPFLWETTQNDPQGLTCR